MDASLSCNTRFHPWYNPYYCIIEDNRTTSISYLWFKYVIFRKKKKLINIRFSPGQVAVLVEAAVFAETKQICRSGLMNLLVTYGNLLKQVSWATVVKGAVLNVSDKPPAADVRPHPYIFAVYVVRMGVPRGINLTFVVKIISCNVLNKPTSFAIVNSWNNNAIGMKFKKQQKRFQFFFSLRYSYASLSDLCHR